MAVVITGADLQSEQLIARLLENDLLSFQSFKQAENLQLEQVLATSAEAQGRIVDPSTKITSDADADLAFELYVEDARVSSDAAYAQAMQYEANARETSDHQYALRLAAAERYAWRRSFVFPVLNLKFVFRKFNLDAVFAQKLQEYADAGKDIDKVTDAERLDNVSFTEPTVQSYLPFHCSVFGEKATLDLTADTTAGAKDSGLWN